MQPKRRPSASDGSDHNGRPPAKRRRRRRSSPAARRRDMLSGLSDELLIRILSHLGPHELLACIAPLSRRLHRLAADSQLWRAHYYQRFVLPRALRIPGFRVGGSSSESNHRLHYSARKAVWADGGWGRRGGVVDVREPGRDHAVERLDWKKQYKLRHNWAQGKCAVEEVSVRDASSGAAARRTLVKVVEGIAVTADSPSGLRAWDLRTRQPITQASFQEDAEHEGKQPSCLAVDEQSLTGDGLDITVGFSDGAFGIWRLDIGQRTLTRCYLHEKSCNGELVAVAYSRPYALTATNAGLISLYTFDRPSNQSQDDPSCSEDDCVQDEHRAKTARAENKAGPVELPAPYLLTSLKSHTTRPPLALSIRKIGSLTSASIAYTFDSRDGWCIGIQDIHIQPSSPAGSTAEVLSSRLAYTLPITTGNSTSPPSPLSSPTRLPQSSPTTPALESPHYDGPTSLCYSHPYLLATLPDNTLVLYLCTSTASSLSISPGMRLWGHTSGISDAEITPRGKAVSVSTRGDEIRLWELEGRVGGSSIEVRPRQQSDDADTSQQASEWEDKRNWVGFDDEMVIVLKEARDGRESLMVYDFT